MKARGLSITAFMAVALIVSGMVGCAGRSSAVATADSEDGGVILQSECTVCHDLGGLPAFADYWGEPEWRSLIETMIGY